MTRFKALGAALFTLTALFVSSVDAANVLKIVSGDKQTVQRSGNSVPGGQAAFEPLTVQITDPAGKPLSGLRVNFFCGSPTTGLANRAMACQMNPAGSGGGSATTDASGNATLKGMGGKSVVAYYASGKMPITVAADNTNQVVFDLTVLDAAAPPPPVAGAKMAIVSGNNQKVARVNTSNGIAIATFASPTVSLKDGSGKALTGVRVTWSCSKPAQMACDAMDFNTTTDGNGNASLPLRAYYADGAIKLTATYGSATASFDLTVAPATAAGPTAGGNVLKIVSGDKQTVQRTGNSVPGGQAAFEPLVVQLTDPSGKPIANSRVNFFCGSPTTGLANRGMACQMNPAGSGGGSATTDASGNASLKGMGGKSVVAYYASGAMPITVATDNANQVVFNLTVLDAAAPPPPVAGAKMAIVSGNNQKATRVNTSNGIAIASFAPLTVSVKDASGKALSGVRVTWSCSKPAAMACDATDFNTTTDGNGNATLPLRAYYADGAIKLTAAYGSANQVFSLTVGP